MFCPACGTAVEAGDRFCEHCGRPLRPGTEEATAAQPQATGAPPGSGAYEGSAPSPGAAWGPEPPPPPYGWGPPASAPGPAASPSYEPSPYYGAPPYHGAPPSFQTYAGQAPPYPDYGSERSAPLAPFGAPLAGWWQRVGAMLLDGLIVGVPLVILNGVLNAAFGTRHLVVLADSISVSGRSLQGSGRAALILFDLVAGLLYFAILNGTAGARRQGTMRRASRCVTSPRDGRSDSGGACSAPSSAPSFTPRSCSRDCSTTCSRPGTGGTRRSPTRWPAPSSSGCAERVWQAALPSLRRAPAGRGRVLPALWHTAESRAVLGEALPGDGRTGVVPRPVRPTRLPLLGWRDLDRARLLGHVRPGRRRRRQPRGGTAPRGRLAGFVRLAHARPRRARRRLRALLRLFAPVPVHRPSRRDARRARPFGGRALGRAVRDLCRDEPSLRDLERRRGLPVAVPLDRRRSRDRRHDRRRAVSRRSSSCRSSTS